MTNEERKEMYQEWENFVFEIFCQWCASVERKKNDSHDSRCALLIETIRDIGEYIGFDTTAFMEAISKYDKEACKADVEPKVGEIYRVTQDVYLNNVYFGEEVYLWKGDIVKIISEATFSCEVQSLMPTKNGDGKWRLLTDYLEEV